MALSWSKRRRALYTLVAAVVAFVVLVWLYLSFFNYAPTCFDGKQNGTERDIDCGGGCALVCRQDARSPVVLWNRSFLVGQGTYTAAAYVQNPNIGAGAKRVPYSFQLFDEKNALVVERTGVVDIPPVQTVPIIDANINVGNRTVTRALFAFGTDPVWYKVSNVSSLRVSNQFLAQDATELRATINNDTGIDASKVTVVAVLFDGAGVARAASKSLLSKVPRRGSQNVIFTWPGGVPSIVRAEITVLPSF
jgi:hypothetical protein